MPKSSESLLQGALLPSVAIVIATLGKRNNLLAKTLESVKAQAIPKSKIIMIYPKNNKETANLANRYNAVSLDDTGDMSSAVNLGIKFVWNDYDYVTWIGDDDLLLPGSLQYSLTALENNKKATATYGYCQYINQEGNPLFLSKTGKMAKYIARWGPNLIPLPGSVYRSSGLKKLDYIFDESLRYSMDLDLFLRLIKRKELLALNYPVAAFRWHTNSTTVSHRKQSLAEAAKVKRRYLSKPAQFIAPAWEVPVLLATMIAQKKVNSTKHSK